MGAGSVGRIGRRRPEIAQPFGVLPVPRRGHRDGRATEGEHCDRGHADSLQHSCVHALTDGGHRAAGDVTGHNFQEWPGWSSGFGTRWTRTKMLVTRATPTGRPFWQWVAWPWRANWRFRSLPSRP